MPKHPFHCWDPDQGEERADAIEVEAYDGEAAAQKFLEERDWSDATVTKEAFIWAVEATAEAEPVLYFVHTERTVIYCSREAHQHTCACGKVFGCASVCSGETAGTCDRCDRRRQLAEWRAECEAADKADKAKRAPRHG